MPSSKTVAMTLLTSVLFVATADADEKAKYVSLAVFRTVPDWVAETSPLTAARHEFPAVESPPQSTATRPAETSIDGTWRDEGGFVVISLGGREFRLRKTAAVSHATTRVTLSARSATEPKSDARPAATSGGIVDGRLLNRKRPLVNCRVSLIPLRRTYFGYAIDGDAQPQTATTDAIGDYRFERVPPGRYKLYWLPAGHRRWIRRLEIKPDIVVRDGVAARVKTIRVALRTIN